MCFYFVENGAGSDSDTNADDLPEYYQPISSTVDDDDAQISDQLPNHVQSYDDDESYESNHFHRLPNAYAHWKEDKCKSEFEEEEEEEEEEEGISAVSDNAVHRSFREDKSCIKRSIDSGE
ncbi:uncharacterized protein LOC107792889 [Nicotiana tabacum]|uniref:Uncharacterized protein LOC107792889 n=1 Tax=Nicotiana tabacum TaxID=4097 RepID=A0A1S4A236_TOBAC|nr:PREDICTED: uncharacterized protein LOC107792889 [Nicotiana tabacum]